jgi:hypothetical protein
MYLTCVWYLSLDVVPSHASAAARFLVPCSFDDQHTRPELGPGATNWTWHSHKFTFTAQVSLPQGKEAELSGELDLMRHALQVVNLVKQYGLQKLLCNKTCTLMAQLLGGLMAYVVRGLATSQVL